MESFRIPHLFQAFPAGNYRPARMQPDANSQAFSMSLAMPSRRQKSAGSALMHKVYRLLDVPSRPAEGGRARIVWACVEQAHLDRILREARRWSATGVGSPVGSTAIQECGQASPRNATRVRRPFWSVASRPPFQRIEPVRDLAERRVDLAELPIGLHVDLVIELGALVLVGVLAVLADEDEARDQDRLDGEDDPEEAVGMGMTSV